MRVNTRCVNREGGRGNFQRILAEKLQKQKLHTHIHKIVSWQRSSKQHLSEHSSKYDIRTHDERLQLKSPRYAEYHRPKKDRHTYPLKS